MHSVQVFPQLSYRYTVKQNRRQQKWKKGQRGYKKGITIKVCGSDSCKLLGKLTKSSAHRGYDQENGLMLTPKINTHLLRTVIYRQVQRGTGLWTSFSMQTVTEAKPTKPPSYIPMYSSSSHLNIKGKAYYHVPPLHSWSQRHF